MSDKQALTAVYFATIAARDDSMSLERAWDMAEKLAEFAVKKLAAAKPS